MRLNRNHKTIFLWSILPRNKKDKINKRKIKEMNNQRGIQKRKKCNHRQVSAKQGFATRFCHI